MTQEGRWGVQPTEWGDFFWGGRPLGTSWHTLKAIIDDDRKIRREKAAEPPAACPFDGLLLDIHPVRGVRNCPAGDYRWP